MRWLHLSGIIPAIGPGAARISLDAIEAVAKAQQKRVGAGIPSAEGRVRSGLALTVRYRNHQGRHPRPEARLDLTEGNRHVLDDIVQQRRDEQVAIVAFGCEALHVAGDADDVVYHAGAILAHLAAVQRNGPRIGSAHGLIIIRAHAQPDQRQRVRVAPEHASAFCPRGARTCTGASARHHSNVEGEARQWLEMSSAS